MPTVHFLLRSVGCPSPSVETAGLLVSCLFFQHTFCSKRFSLPLSPHPLLTYVLFPSLLAVLHVSAEFLGVPCLSAAGPGWLGLSIAYGLVVRGKCCGHTHNAESALPSLGLALSEEATLVLAPVTACTHLLLFQKTCVQFPASMY